MKAVQKYTLITGATSGIGYELAQLFAADGHHLIIVARHQEALDSTAVELMQQYGIDVVKFSKDLFVPQNAFDLYNEVIDQGLQVDILVNDAGQGHYGEFVETDIISDLEIIQLNISSVVVLTKLFLKDMVARGEGKILNLSSVASKVPGPLQSVYHGTKAFIQSFTEAIREEVKDKDITVTALLPGATATDFFNKAGMLDARNVQEGDLADPADVAKAGYAALMKGEDKVVAGFKNKVKVAMSNITPDETLAKKVHKEQEPVNKEEEK